MKLFFALEKIKEWITESKIKYEINSVYYTFWNANKRFNFVRKWILRFISDRRELNSTLKPPADLFDPVKPGAGE